MKLHTKLILTLLACLSVVVILAQLIQYLQISGQIEELSESNLSLLTEREEEYSRNLYRSVANSVEDSLNRGEMDKFGKLLTRAQEIEGLEEFSLFDTNGEVTYSSDNSFLGVNLPSEVLNRIKDGEGLMFQMDDKAIEIYHPQKVVRDCLRCHVNWSLDDPHGGVLYFRFSAAALTEAKVQAAKAIENLNSTYLTDAVLSVVAVLVVLVVAIFFLLKKMVGKPLNGLNGVFTKMATGDLTVKSEIMSKDEIGELSDNFNVFTDSIHNMVGQIANQVGILKASSGSLNDLSVGMTQGAEEMAQKSNDVSASAAEMSENMGTVADSMVEANGNINMVAAATEEMTATIDEISNNAESARQISEKAVLEAENATKKMRGLGDSAQNIGKVTETITEISEQTNLLALNATIEAARAGEAGKGFAVVAQEIKELAKQTATATSEISNRIFEIQDNTSGAIDEIEQISNVINEVNAIIGTIATAVEEQSAATREISSNISLASHGIEQVNENVRSSAEVADGINGDIKDVDTTSGNISQSSSEVSNSAKELSKLAELLQDLVAEFKL